MPAARLDTVSALHVRGLRKAYDGVPVLDGIDLTVDAGSLHALLGPNGAGKSTLLRILLGLVRADAGDVRLLDRPPDAGLDGVAGFIETPSFWPYLTVRDTLCLLGKLEPEPGDADELLARVGLTGAARARVAGLSVGMRQRLGIAAALQRRPRLLLLDEPSTGLDPAGARDLHALLRELAADGAAVLLSSHLMTEVDALCDVATVLARGRVVATGTLPQLRRRAPDPRTRLRSSDDTLAAEVLATRGVACTPGRDGLLLRGTTEVIDGAVLALASHGVSVRELVALGSPIEELFLTLTADAG